MSQPIDVDLPHNLGKDEARRRIANNVHKLEEHIPGGAKVQSGWTGDQLNLNIAAMGEAVNATIEVMDTKVHLKVLLPGMLGMCRRRAACCWRIIASPDFVAQRRLGSTLSRSATPPRHGCQPSLA